MKELLGNSAAFNMPCVSPKNISWLILILLQGSLEKVIVFLIALTPVLFCISPNLSIYQSEEVTKKQIPFSCCFGVWRRFCQIAVLLL